MIQLILAFVIPWAVTYYWDVVLGFFGIKLAAPAAAKTETAQRAGQVSKTSAPAAVSDPTEMPEHLDLSSFDYEEFQPKDIQH